MQAGGLIDSQLKSTYLADFQAVWFMTLYFIITGTLFL